MKTFPEISKVLTASKDGKYFIENSMNCLFNLMDSDKDGFVDSLELGIGLTKIFPSKREYNSTNRVELAGIFTKMDFNEQGAIFFSDV
jgi:Ca2+-binding EF-hand superfamily protein